MTKPVANCFITNCPGVPKWRCAVKSGRPVMLCDQCHDAYMLGTVNEHTKKRIVKISVRGGVAEVTQCPPGVTVKIKDHDKQG